MTSLEQIAKWHHNDDRDAAKASMAQTRGGMMHLYHLDDIPNVESSDGDSLVAASATTTLEGELHQFWAISDPDNPAADPIPLPSWFHLPIDNVLLTWRKEHMIWEERRNKRRLQGYESLAPKMQKNFEEWSSAQTRMLVLDKKRHAQVVNVSKKSTHQLKRTCLMLVLHPSLEPANLRISSGNGKQWSLRLLEGKSIPNVDVPEVVDHFPGSCSVFCFGKVFLQQSSLLQQRYLQNHLMCIYIYISFKQYNCLFHPKNPQYTLCTSYITFKYCIKSITADIIHILSAQCLSKRRWCRAFR